MGAALFINQNFVLICASIVLYTLAIQRFKAHRRISFLTILVVSCALLVAIFGAIEETAKSEGIMYLAIVMAILGYTSRPACIYFLIMMTKTNIPKKNFWLTFLPLLINSTVYILALLPFGRELVFGFFRVIYQDTGKAYLVFTGGVWLGGLLRYTSHIVSALYLGYLLVSCIKSLRTKHIGHTIALIACSSFIIVAVIIETFFNPTNSIYILNSTIGVSTLTYYLFIYIEKGQVDTLTGLLNRETYYHDILEMDALVKGVIQFNIVGLKGINNNDGLDEGDKVLKFVADAIKKSIPERMSAYRLGADEFVVISSMCLEAEIVQVISKFNSYMLDSPYKVAVGYAYCFNHDVDLEGLLKESERKMLLDKERLNGNSQFEYL